MKYTAIRYCKSFCGLDLQGIQLLPFAKIEYQRASSIREFSVIYIPAIWDVSLSDICSRATKISLPSSPSEKDKKSSSSKESEADTKVKKETVKDENDEKIKEENVKEEPVKDEKVESNEEDKENGGDDEELENSETPTDEDEENPVAASKGDDETSGDDSAQDDHHTDSKSIKNEEDVTMDDNNSSVELEEDDKILLVTKVPEGIKLKPLDLSLYGLLEYDETDEAEKTFEVSLSGEFFSDLLKKEFGHVIRNALDNFRIQRSKMLINEEDAPPLKKQKTSHEESSEGTEKSDDKKEKSTDEKKDKESKSADDDDDSKADNKSSEEKPEIPLKGNILHDAFDYFDRRSKGYFRPEQLEDILYSLGEHFPIREVEELVDPLIDPDTGRILYKKLISTGVISYCRE